MTLATVQDDALYYYPGTKRKVKNWYGNSYRGLTSLREAMAQSMNVIAVKTLNDVSPKIGYDYLLNLGIDLPLITNLIIQLNLKGYHIDTSINDIDDLVEAIGGEFHG